MSEIIGRAPPLFALSLYVVFAVVVYVVQGSQPPLSIDHVSYFKLADDIRAEFPHGDYWRSFNSVRVYGVILAYLFDITASHILDLKLLLAALTVAYLWAFQLFMELATNSRPRAILFSLLSALFVTFGASIWGMTDFSASLNRTLIIPGVVLLVWFFFREFDAPWRYAIYPALIVLSLLHLSALHIFLLFLVFEVLDFAFRRRCRIDRNVGYFVMALFMAVATQGLIDFAWPSASPSASYMRYALNMALPHKHAGGVATSGATPRAIAPRPKRAPTGGGGSSQKLTAADAWRIELMAFPWRNFPPTIATLATIALSFGVILVLAVLGAVRTLRSSYARTLDRRMVTFAAATAIAAYGLQICLWVARKMVPVFPINFEEIRVINMLMIPSVYFVFRLYEHPPSIARLPDTWVRVMVLAAFVLQPMVVLKALPERWREGLIQEAIAWNLLKTSDAPRMIYARQVLGLAGDGRRFYYSSRPVMAWLESNVRPDDLVLTDLNEFDGSQVPTIGPFVKVVALATWDTRREAWARTVHEIDAAMASRNTARVEALARSVGATYAVVDWSVTNAAYHDDYYSVIRVNGHK